MGLCGGWLQEILGTGNEGAVLLSSKIDGIYCPEGAVLCSAQLSLRADMPSVCFLSLPSHVGAGASEPLGPACGPGAQHTQTDTGTCWHQQGLSFLLLPHRFAQMKSEANQSVA